MTEKEPLVSIVIPIYNGEEYLERLWYNFVSQTYTNWEAIFVNDMSSDNTLEILLKYANLDNRFVVLNRSTKGGTAVKGIEYALPHCRGDYFFFMSHDDFF